MSRSLSFATATLALFFAISGGTLAAKKHYLVNSTKQINPEVLRALKGNRGPAGVTGKEGPPGKEGKTGPPGPAGAAGVTGATGPTGPSASGATGATGPTGEKGEKGTTGATGPTGAAGSNGANGSNGQSGTGSNGGANGSNGATGATGPTGAAGSNGGGGGAPFGTTGANELSSKGALTGVWHATIIAPKGFRQVETEGDISYPLRLKTGEKPTVVYKNELQSKTPTTSCPGGTEKPSASEGTLCVYTGGGFGAQEVEFKNAKFFGVVSPAGETCETIPEGKECKAISEMGSLVLFRTSGFENVEGGGAALTEDAYLNQFGSWAVKSK
jgi:hypothetical protein